MENNEYNPSLTRQGLVDDAVAALSAVNESEVRAREAARPPQWYLVSICVCLGAMVGSAALPERGRGIVVALICMIEGFLMVRLALTRRVSPGGFGVFTPLRAYVIPLVILFVLLVGTVLWTTAPGTRGLLPWWGDLVLGLAVGLTMYVVADWSWGKWVHRR